MNTSACRLPGLITSGLAVFAFAGTPRFPWPDPTFLKERQCHGQYATEALDRLLPRARVALWLPGTRTVTVDP